MAPTRDALRVQAAAVAAQQAALNEDESHLRQQRLSLEQQQAQLAAHLDAKRGRLIELRDQARQAYAELKAERAKYERSIAETMKKLEVDRAEIADAQKQVRDERDRVRRLLKQLKRRWHRHWLAERTALRRREEQFTAQCQDLARDQERVQAAKEELYRARCRLNGEVEVGRRQMQEARNQLQQEQRACEERRTKEWHEIEGTRRQLEVQAAEQAAAARTLGEQQRRWEARRYDLEKETAGLDQRIHNQRCKLLEQEEALRHRETGQRHSQSAVASSPPTPEKARELVPVLPTALQQREWQLQEAENHVREELATLERLSADLDDQRLHLTGECALVNETRQRWQEERAVATAELDLLARGVEAREQALVARETEQRLRREEIERFRQYLFAWQAHLDRRAAAWNAERERLLADLQSWEEQSAAQSADGHDLNRMRQKIHSLQAQACVYEQQIRELNDAIERLAWALLDDRDAGTVLPVARAA